MTFLTTREAPAWSPEKPDVLVNIVDGIAKRQPDAPFAYYPVNPTSYDAGYRCITYGDFANIINGLAWWLTKEFGPGQNFETLAYLGGNDIRYNGFILAANKAGYRMFFTSPRNSPAAHASLFKQTDSKILITPDPSMPLAAAVAAAGNLRCIQAPSIEYLFGEVHPEFIYQKSLEEAMKDPLVVLHTSGTTGLPKPLTWPQGIVLSLWNMMQLDTPPGYRITEHFLTAKKLFVTLPPFHAGGVCWGLLIPLLRQVSVIMPISGAIPTAQLVVDGLNAIDADCALLIPTMVEEINKKPEQLDFLSKRLEFAYYAGGDILLEHGNFINKKLPLYPVYAGADIGLPPQLQPEKAWTGEDWGYIRFHLGYGIEFRHLEDNLHEIVFINKHKTLNTQFMFEIFSDKQEYYNGDLFSPHPTKPDLWKYRGRSDDIIVFLTGEKTNPITMEQHICRHPDVKAALVTGTKRFQAALILELVESKELGATERANIIEKVWPVIEEANEDCPRFAKISKEFILIASPAKPLPRAGKGTIQRRPALDLFAEDLDALYNDAEKMKLGVMDNSIMRAPESSIATDQDALSTIIHDLVLKLTTWAEVDNNQNFFINGMDSLQALILTRNLRSTLAVTDLAPSIVYANPSVSLLTEALFQRSSASQKTIEQEEKLREDAVEGVLNEQKKHIDNIGASSKANVAHKASRHTTGNVVILTGSTGWLGSHLLGCLLSSLAVSHVYCLNRAADSKKLQQTRNQTRGLSYDLDTSKVTFLTSDLTSPKFGVSEDVYDDLISDVTHIIHAAWPVNFNLSFASFIPSLKGLTALISFAAESSHHADILFISSISTVISSRESLVPETIPQSLTVTAPLGYAESKYAAEHLLDYATSNVGLRTRIARLGQISPCIESDTGMSAGWNQNEWFPSLIISSSTLRKVPDHLGPAPLDWVPVDVIAETVHDIAFASNDRENNGTANVFQVVNSNLVAWDRLLPSVVSAIAEHGNTVVQTVPLREWINSVREDAEKVRNSDQSKSEASKDDVAKMLAQNPAAKLLEFYEGLLATHVAGESEIKARNWENKAARNSSEALRKLGPVNEGWIKAWVKGCLP